MSSFLTRLDAVATDVEAALERWLPEPIGRQAVIMEAMRYAALGGGKRLRPFLVIETARLLGGPEESALQVGCALECLHVYSLVHDDLPCMDDDDLRRGKPTVHKAYDEATAVLAGDGLLTFAFELLARKDCHADPAVRAGLVADLAIAGGTFGMIGGQVIDITVSETERDEALVTDLQARKTGALIRYATQAGVTLSGGTEADMARLTDYATRLGLAFQIQDDVLDVEGDATQMGKAVRKDEDLGKATFVSLLGLETAKKRARELGEEAKDALSPYGDKAESLIGAVDFVLERTH